MLYTENRCLTSAEIPVELSALVVYGATKDPGKYLQPTRNPVTGEMETRQVSPYTLTCGHSKARPALLFMIPLGTDFLQSECPNLSISGQ